MESIYFQSCQKEEKTTPRQSGKARRKAQKFSRVVRNFWRWRSKHKKVVLLILFGIVLYVRPDIKEFLVEEKIIQLLQLVLGL